MLAGWTAWLAVRFLSALPSSSINHQRFIAYKFSLKHSLVQENSFLLQFNFFPSFAVGTIYLVYNHAKMLCWCWLCLQGGAQVNVWPCSRLIGKVPYEAVVHLCDALSIEQLLLGQKHVKQEFRRYEVNLSLECVLRFVAKPWIKALMLNNNNNIFTGNVAMLLHFYLWNALLYFCELIS